ncbi:hypothetical protein JDV02_004968 [Purpureocillium takamizusanense]|uniref:Uncharacterized protein n=1 Tax=Purpureocillium takamizusanense TaxID=2060973 RepID=A0A9Q8QFH3_9HYPO|nr:uncharacterized protein JDV02_004968 [Purpureocillium takamizusanense]UNI18715.1 hypothetical protein JDV02_004968 [Purpureocillium takamizusanense]
MTSEEKFAVLAKIQTFADVWGPVWSVPAQDGKPTHMSQHLLSKGVIRAPYGQQNPQIAGRMAVLCHWDRYRSPVQQKHDARLYTYMDMDAWLLIQGNLRNNDECRYTLDHYESHVFFDAGFLGTVSETWNLDTRTYGMTAGQWLNLVVSGTHKRIPGIPLKDHILNKFKFNPQNANIEWLNNFVGAEISHCTGNARRVRMRDILKLRSVQGRLLRYDPLWEATDWGRRFYEALRDDEVRVLTDLWDQNVEMRRNIANLICQILELLHTTGTQGEHLIVAYFSKNVDRQIELNVRGNDWARLFEDSEKSATFAVVGDTCMTYQGTARETVARCLCGRDGLGLYTTVLQTRVLFPDGFPCSNDIVSIKPHKGNYRILHVETNRAKQVMLEPADANISRRKPVHGWEVMDGDPRRPREQHEMRAIIKASTVTHAGMNRERQAPLVAPAEAHHHRSNGLQGAPAANQRRKQRRQRKSPRTQTPNQCCYIL